MDSKERFLVDELCRRITQQIFHERDILALLILLRGHSAAKSPVRELADFIAHREKTLGKIKEYVQHVVAYGQALCRRIGGLDDNQIGRGQPEGRIQAVHRVNLPNRPVFQNQYRAIVRLLSQWPEPGAKYNMQCPVPPVPVSTAAWRCGGTGTIGGGSERLFGPADRGGVFTWGSNVCFGGRG
jgi:hypothetical protein